MGSPQTGANRHQVVDLTTFGLLTPRTKLHDAGGDYEGMASRQYSYFSRATLVILLSSQLLCPIVRYFALEPLPTLRFPIFCNEPEACFALGSKVPFKDADQYSLQLLKGIGEDVASEIVQVRPKICLDARRLSEDSAWKALVQVRGLGEALARKVTTYFALHPEALCATSG